WTDETDWEHSAWAQAAQFPGSRMPEFLPDLAWNVSVTLARDAVLPCRVANLRGRSVSWIRQTDLQVLTTNSITFTTDERFSVEGYSKGATAVWDLHINDVTQEDEGVYQCQVNTRPKMSHPVRLHVVEGRAQIAGPHEVYLHAGSRLLLTCWLLAPPHPPPLIWTHNTTVLNDTTARGGLSLFMSHEGARASTRLSLQRVDAKDAGNYTCHPRDLPSASVSVYVLHEKEPAAMHHDSGISFHQSNIPLLVVLTAPLVCLQLSVAHPLFS
ncbi:Immunoglobulin V-set domain, partial [Trinorchestia longiramus]